MHPPFAPSHPHGAHGSAIDAGNRPAVAIVSANTLAAVGLSGLIEGLMPMAQVRIFSAFDPMMEAERTTTFYHYFITTAVLLDHVRFFLERRRKTIVLVEGKATNVLPADFHTIDISLPQDELLRSIMRMEQAIHGQGHPQPEPVVRAQTPLRATVLTPRETEVLRLLVLGLTNKEVAAELGVGLTTIISHRKNIVDKLKMKSLSALTVYAVAHGIVKVEEI